MSRQTAYVLCCLISFLEDLAVFAMALFLSSHTDNYKWMWLLALISTTNYFRHIRFNQIENDNDKKEGEE